MTLHFDTPSNRTTHQNRTYQPMNEYNYAEWLKTHAKKKALMEKLERSLVPYPLFAQLDLEGMREGDGVEVEYGENVYHCLLQSRSVVNERDVLLFTLSKSRITDEWDDLLMGFSDFKVILHEGKIVTIYPFQEHYFDQIMSQFEAEAYDALYECRTLYMKNMLARYILLRLIHTHQSHLALLYSVRHQGKVIPVLAGRESKEWIMYAFSKKEANDLARSLHDKCKRLTVVYFINRNFENEYANHNFISSHTQVISIKQFYRSFHLARCERMKVERQILFLIEMLYEQRLEWNISALRKAIQRAPRLQDRKFAWMEVPKMLVEDALSVLVEDYNNPRDIFHMLCAANLVNTYTNRYKDARKLALRNRGKSARAEKVFLHKRVHIMYHFKNQVMETILRLLEMRSPHLRVTMAHVLGCKDYTILAGVKVDGRSYQFKFRGIHQSYITRLKQLGISDRGQCDAVRLQPIAPALYLYAYQLKWKNL